MNILCLGARVIHFELAWKLIRTFLDAHLTGTGDCSRTLIKVERLEQQDIHG